MTNCWRRVTASVKSWVLFVAWRVATAACWPMPTIARAPRPAARLWSPRSHGRVLAALAALEVELLSQGQHVNGRDAGGPHVALAELSTEVELAELAELSTDVEFADEAEAVELLLEDLPPPFLPALATWPLPACWWWGMGTARAAPTPRRAMITEENLMVWAEGGLKGVSARGERVGWG